MYSLFDRIIRRWSRKRIAKISFSKVIWMPTRFTTRKENFRSYSRDRETHFSCCKYWFFRCNSFVWYSEIQSILRDRELCATISTMSTSISRIRCADSVIRLSSWFCIDLIQTTKQIRSRNRQEKFKRVTKSFDHCIFIEIFCEIVDSDFFFCFVCVALFVTISFLSQLLRVLFVIDSTFATYSKCQKIVCKQCEKIFESKNKLHEHIRQHHVKSTKKMIKDASRRNFNKERNKISSTISNISSRISTTSTTRFSISKFVTFSESSRIASFAFSSISFAISAIIASITSSKRSRFSLFTSKSTSKRAKITSKFVKIASNCSFISLATSTSKFRKSISKFYFTIHDFHRMFVEKSRSFDLRQHQNRRFSSQSFESRQSDRSSFFYQSRIIAYFLSAINQKTSINQNLKSSNSKNFQQSTFAKSFSFCHRSASALSEKSIFSSYKNSDIFYISLQSKFSFLQSKFSFAWFRSTLSFTFSSFFRSSSLFESPFSDLYVYCICFDHFSFRNDSFNYRRFNQRYFSNRRPIEKRDSRFETKFAKKKRIVLRACFENIVAKLKETRD